MIPVFITGRPVITKWDDYSTFDILTVAEYLSEQLWECYLYCNPGKTKATWKGMRNGKFPNQLIFEIGK